MFNQNKKNKVMLVASAGGHWVQLLRLKAAFEGFEVDYMSTAPFNANELDGKLHVVTDANLREKLKAMKMALQVFWVLLKVRPKFIVTTGALPGLTAIALGRLFGARTIWIDSIANAETMSLSGRGAKHFAHAWLTQWPNVSTPDGPDCWGKVL